MKWKLVSVHFEMVLISTQYRCTRCADGAIVLEVMFDMIPLGFVPNLSMRGVG